MTTFEKFVHVRKISTATPQSIVTSTMTKKLKQDCDFFSFYDYIGKFTQNVHLTRENAKCVFKERIASLINIIVTRRFLIQFMYIQEAVDNTSTGVAGVST